MHDFIKLTANLKIQLRNMMVEDRFIQLLHFMPGFLQTLHKHFHRGGHARVAEVSAITVVSSKPFKSPSSATGVKLILSNSEAYTPPCGRCFSDNGATRQILGFVID
ncbi:Uncharacterised protein [Raoultella terrigena]|uniref:Uncharacterized protein n=1 Tax=Raoultella terrigena TaxID=577 RepID=A0A3P8JIG5_RAOTE|nr:Uncharacterised protein [Raoultella terrigena]